jgi:hypothetical protein
MSGGTHNRLAEEQDSNFVRVCNKIFNNNYYESNVYKINMNWFQYKRSNPNQPIEFNAYIKQIKKKETVIGIKFIFVKYNTELKRWELDDISSTIKNFISNTSGPLPNLNIERKIYAFKDLINHFKPYMIFGNSVTEICVYAPSTFRHIIHQGYAISYKFWKNLYETGSINDIKLKPDIEHEQHRFHSNQRSTTLQSQQRSATLQSQQRSTTLPSQQRSTTLPSQQRSATLPSQQRSTTLSLNKRIVIKSPTNNTRIINQRKY